MPDWQVAMRLHSEDGAGPAVEGGTVGREGCRVHVIGEYVPGQQVVTRPHSKDGAGFAVEGGAVSREGCVVHLIALHDVAQPWCTCAQVSHLISDS